MSLLTARVTTSRLLNTLTGGKSHQMISTRMYLSNSKLGIALINILFWDSAHCRDSYYYDRKENALAKITKHTACCYPGCTNGMFGLSILFLGDNTYCDSECCANHRLVLEGGENLDTQELG